MTLREYFDREGRGSQERMSEQLECSKGYLSLVARGERFPGRAFALRIEEATGGKVKAATVMGLEAA
jgi:transcriptional regulator with XRE-family HTH domain